MTYNKMNIYSSNKINTITYI